MHESTNPKAAIDQQRCLELALLQSVLDDEVSYPWNPTDPDAIAHADQLQSELGELSEDDFDSQWSQVAQLATHLWETPADSLVDALTHKFGDRMPRQLLTQLATAVQTTAQNSSALIDQLVTSAQTVLTDWATDDLQVMARPLAMAMRGGHAEIVDVTLQSIRPVDWEELSAIEQARLSLAIARYALDEVKPSE
jgi:hypothetical protein